MAYYEAPSFSLGLDLDFDLEPQIREPNHSPHTPASDVPVKDNDSLEEGEGGESGTGFVDCAAEIGIDSHRKLKRIKRGPPAPDGSSLAKRKESPPSLPIGDDDIEEFSSQENSQRVVTEPRPSTHFQSVCSTSKPPLHGILTPPTCSRLKAKQKEQVLDTPVSMSSEEQNKSLFSSLTISPLRKFQLIESDSDDSSGCNNQSRKRHEMEMPFNRQKSVSDYYPTTHEKQKILAASVAEKEDLWKDFCPTRSFHVPTPAFDEVCKEYSKLGKENIAASDIGSNKHMSGKDPQTNNRSCSNQPLDGFSCPAHYYYHHDDPRVQKLVRNRLPNFIPLGVDGSQTSLIDYMRQFSNGEASTSQPSLQTSMDKNSNKRTSLKGSKNIASQGRANVKGVSSSDSKKAPKRAAAQKKNNNKSSRSVNNRLGASNSEKLFNESESWIDPRSSFSLPKDAGKRRIQASGQSSGQWYTSPEGRKVYITKGGEELTGRAAYMHYKKDSGGFRKSKKKASGQKRKK